MAIYDSGLSMRDARTLYFEINNFKNGGYDDRWVKIRVGPLPIAFPNTRARLRVVKYHDLHHVLTEYSTTWKGEAQIGAWEVATGCPCNYAAWILNLLGFAVGLLICPRATYRAFMRGRHSANLYKRDFSEELLSQRVGELRAELRLDEGIKRRSRQDKLSFLMWALVSALTYFATGAILLAPLAILVLLALRLSW